MNEKENIEKCTPESAKNTAERIQEKIQKTEF